MSQPSIIISKVHLTNFRKLKSLLVEIEAPVCVVIAPNASGKTTILEAIQLLSTGESFRADKTEEMISFGEELGRVAGLVTPEKSWRTTQGEEVDDESASILNLLSAEEKEVVAAIENGGDESAKKEPERLEVMITRGLAQGKRTQSKLYSLNHAKKRKRDFIGQFGSVVFRPEDMRLIEGSPSRRRSFLNTPLCQVDLEYEQALKQYEQTLLRRNKLLGQIKEGLQKRETLAYWNQNLISSGRIIQEKRWELIEFFNRVNFPLKLKAHYDQSLMSTERLAQYADAEVAVGHTLVGPHKDDLQALLDFNQDGEAESWENVAIYGSRGQQRLAVLWLKLGELLFIEEKLEQKPVLLLDDILSELDDQSKNLVLGLLKKHQTVITTTEERTLEVIDRTIENVQVIRI